MDVRTKRGFTLVEAMVLLAIIAIMAALIAPEVKSAMAKAKIEAEKTPEEKAAPPAEELLRKRFSFSVDLGSPGMFAYHIKDATTGREWLIVYGSGHNVAATLEVTPPPVEKEKP